MDKRISFSFFQPTEFIHYSPILTHIQCLRCCAISINRLSRDERITVDAWSYFFSHAFQGTMSYCAPIFSKRFAHDQKGPWRGRPSHDWNHAPLPIAPSWKCAWWCHSIQVLPSCQRRQQPSMQNHYIDTFYRRRKNVFEWSVCLECVSNTRDYVRLHACPIEKQG